jgi:energy-coupling factor transporter ATP-binding protein EcfA2
MNIKRATRKQAKLRLALIGPAGSGKTYTALRVARVLADAGSGRILVFDTERGSASKYAGRCDEDVGTFDFDVVEDVSNFSPQTYAEVVRLAEREGYDVLVIDSLSHAWMGKDGALELVDKTAARMKQPNNFAAWREVTPLHNAMVDTIIGSRVHVIATMRSKIEYVQDRDDGKPIVRKIGMQPVQRDGLEYEFDVVGDLDQDNTLSVTKTRCPALRGAVIRQPGRAFAELLLGWLRDGDPAPVAPVAPTTPIAFNNSINSIELWKSAAVRAREAGRDDLIEQHRAKTSDSPNVVVEKAAAIIAALEER